MIRISNFNEAQIVINELYRFMEEFKKNNVDLHGRRFTNVGKSQDVNEFVTRDELDIDSRKLRESIDNLNTEIITLKRRVKILEPQSQTV